MSDLLAFIAVFGFFAVVAWTLVLLDVMNNEQ